MIEKLLLKLGLNLQEIKTYLALLQNGKTRTGPLIKSTGIPSSKIYGILDSLVEKGIVGYVLDGKIKLYQVTSPQMLFHLLDKKESEFEETKKELEQELPNFERLFTKEKSDYSVEIFEGLHGVKHVYDLALSLQKPHECSYTIGYPLLASTIFDRYFKKYHEKISANRLKTKVIYDYDTWFAKKRKPRPHVEQRYLPRGIHTPGFIHIFADYVTIMVVTENQKKTILIKNAEVAQSYLQYFNIIWKIAHKI